MDSTENPLRTLINKKNYNIYSYILKKKLIFSNHNYKNNKHT